MFKRDFNKNLNMTFLVFFIFLLSGCSFDINKDGIVEKLKEFDQKIGEEMNKVDNIEESIETDKSNEKVYNLADEEKQKIDQWLSENGLNRYGDSEGVFYPDGSPLFDEELGENMERFEYILNRYPDILKN